MLQVGSELRLNDIEGALRRSAGQRQANIISVAHVGQHLTDAKPGDDAYVFSICAAEPYSALLAGDIRMAAFLPWHIAAYSSGGHVTLESMSPVEACRLLDRPDLAPLAAPLEDLLRNVMEETARGAASATRAAAGAQRGNLGATEDQMSARGAIPQRIDRRGTKVEDLGGTGEHDAQGG